MDKKDNLLGYVAELYYERGLSQKEISAILNVSRPTVSRLIDNSKTQGIVEIKINNPIKKNQNLSEKIRHYFKLRDCIVVCGSYDFDKAIDMSAKAAVEMLDVFLDDGMSLGVTWGRSVNAVASALHNTSISNINVCQLSGCLPIKNPNLSSFIVPHRFAQKFNGSCTNITAPLFVQGKEIYEYLVNEPLIKDAIDKASNVDVSLISVGPIGDKKNFMYQSGYYDIFSLDRFKNKGAVALAAGRFIDINGNEVNVDNLYSISVPLDKLRKIPVTIAVSATADRAEATYAVLNSHCIDVLVIDEALANKLLEIRSNYQRSL